MSADPDVLFVVLDSVRLDRCSAYGHDRETTPALAELASGATTYERAHTPAPWTLPSHCSMFTGLFPTEHGITNGFVDRSVRLPESVRTLPELLADRGYRNAGFSNNPWVGTLSGLDRGFDEFVEWDLEIGRESDATIHTRTDRLLSRAHTVLGQAARTPLYLLKRRFFTSRLVDRATRWLQTPDGGAGDRPTFTFLNVMEAHSPYYPPRSAFRALGLDPPTPLEARRLNTRLAAYVLGRVDLADDRERILEYYDASLRYQDGQFSRLLETLRDTDQFEDTLIIACADHGKTLGEFDRDATPPHYLRPVNTNVPLVVKWPGQEKAERVDRPVELHRVFEAVLGGEREAAPWPTGRGRASEPPGDRLTEPGSTERGDRAIQAALVEDYLPHTSSETTAVTRWRGLAGTAATFVASEDGERYLIDPQDGAVIDATAGELSTHAEHLAHRVAALETGDAAEGDSREPASLGGTTRAQLEDLGYLG